MDSIIVLFQQQNGFHSISDLLKVPGLGPVFLEHNKAILYCNVKKIPHHDK